MRQRIVKFFAREDKLRVCFQYMALLCEFHFTNKPVLKMKIFLKKL